ncbi:MAG TPA: hypothetical protein VK996_12435 [Ramlibacter sp.]|nr:hypothetical protein [Ramlibacter sp.]
MKHRTWSRLGVAVAATLFATALAVPLAAQAQPKRNAELQKLIDAAKKEKKLSISISTPRNDPTIKALIAGYKAHWGLNDIEVVWSSRGSQEGVAVLQVEAKAGRPTVDIQSATPTMVPAMQSVGALKPYDWVAVFGEELPEIKHYVQHVPADFRGLVLAFYDTAYSTGYNTRMITNPAEVPGSLEEFADPKWRGKFALDGTSWTGLSQQTHVIGPEATLALAKRILDNRPLIQNGPAATHNAIVTGAVPIGLTHTRATCLDQRKKAPIEMKYWKSLPTDVLISAPTVTGSAPNAAKLWAAWMVTKGQPIVREGECLEFSMDSDSAAYKRIAKAVGPAEPKFLWPTNDKQAREEDDVRAKLTTLLQSMK